MRTTKDIVEHYREIKDADFLGFQAEVLLPWLSADEVRPFCKPEADLGDWENTPLTEAGVLREMREYMVIAWDKAENHRGISSGRSVDKMEAWLWLLGRDDLLEAIGGTSYENYGAPKLKLICDALDFPVPESETLGQMIQGEPCSPGCNEGCGH